MLRVAGTDPGTSSLDVVIFEDGAVVDQVRFTPSQLQADADTPAGRRPVGVMVVFAKGRVLFVADTSVHEMPTSEELAEIAKQTAEVVRHFGFTPRLALLASSTFGFPRSERTYPAVYEPPHLSAPDLAGVVDALLALPAA